MRPNPSFNPDVATLSYFSHEHSGILVIALALAAVGGLVAAFPGNPLIQARDFGKRFGKVKDNTRSFGIVIISFGLMFFGMWLVLVL